MLWGEQRAVDVAPALGYTGPRIYTALYTHLLRRGRRHTVPVLSIARGGPSWGLRRAKTYGRVDLVLSLQSLVPGLPTADSDSAAFRRGNLQPLDKLI